MENDKTLLPEEEKGDVLGKETGGQTSLQEDDKSGDKKGDNLHKEAGEGATTLESR